MYRYCVIIIVIIGVVGVFSCSNAPFEPVEDQSYKVYFWDEGDIPKYYSYDPVTQVLDSLSLEEKMYYLRLASFDKNIYRSS